MLARTLAILRQDPAIASRLRVRELVAFGRFPHNGGRITDEDRALTQAALERFDLTSFADRFIDPDELYRSYVSDQTISNVSGWNNPAVDKMMNLGRNGATVAERNGKLGVFAVNAKATDFSSAGGKISFTLEANALPWVLPPDAAEGFALAAGGHRLRRHR